MEWKTSYLFVWFLILKDKAGWRRIEECTISEILTKMESEKTNSRIFSGGEETAVYSQPNALTGTETPPTFFVLFFRYSVDFSSSGTVVPWAVIINCRTFGREVTVVQYLAKRKHRLLLPLRENGSTFESLDRVRAEELTLFDQQQQLWKIHPQPPIIAHIYRYVLIFAF